MDAINPNRKPKRAQRVSDTTLRRRLKAATDLAEARAAQLSQLREANHRLLVEQEGIRAQLQKAHEQIEALTQQDSPLPASEDKQDEPTGPNPFFEEVSLDDLFAPETEDDLRQRLMACERQLAIVNAERHDLSVALHRAIKTIGAIGACITDPEKEGD